MTLQDLTKIREILKPYRLRPDDVFVIQPDGEGVDVLSKQEFDLILSKYFEIESVEKLAPQEKDL